MTLENGTSLVTFSITTLNIMTLSMITVTIMLNTNQHYDT
jgi:hypothetical protein